MVASRVPAVLPCGTSVSSISCPVACFPLARQFPCCRKSSSLSFHSAMLTQKPSHTRLLCVPRAGSLVLLVLLWLTVLAVSRVPILGPI